MKVFSGSMSALLDDRFDRCQKRVQAETNPPYSNAGGVFCLYGSQLGLTVHLCTTHLDCKQHDLLLEPVTAGGRYLGISTTYALA